MGQKFTKLIKRANNETQQKTETSAEYKTRLEKLFKKRNRAINNSRRIPDGKYCLDCQRVAGRLHLKRCKAKDNKNLANY